MSEGSRIALPLRVAEDVIPYLGRPDHWKHGRSAKAIADSWFRANDIPSRIKDVLGQIEWYRDARLVDAFLERQTDLRDGCGAPSQTDLLAVVTANADRSLAVVGVEAKVDERFGPLVSEWRNGSATREARLVGFCSLFRVQPEQILDLRYQLFHRAAAVIYEAERYRQDSAVLMVQSFCPRASGSDDFVRFAEALGFKEAGVDRMTNAIKFGSAILALGWTADEIPAAVG